MALSKRSGVSLNGWRGEREDEEPLRSRDIASAIHHHLPTETDVQSSSAPRQEEVRVIILLRDGNETENWTGIGTDNRSSNAGHGRQDEMLQTWGWGVETADDSSNLMKLLGGLMMGLAW
jgi:hypothetical protein